ncbi:sensor domain-containing diguanylate cyclase [Demequina sp. NBRC 110051]|uniref:sensor domain-containing diguanylate cyclase n=1 Tax=Demequina sp. NBRC 110051 TaxID=1570340 RepID=UPI00117EA827|nr:sensor domain-containing diguanylate cyclase [Demequina sp. NBRC 110051]
MSFLTPRLLLTVAVVLMGVQLLIIVIAWGMAVRDLSSTAREQMDRSGSLVTERVVETGEAALTAVEIAASQFAPPDEDFDAEVLTRVVGEAFLYLSSVAHVEASYIAYPDGSFATLQRTDTGFRSMVRHGDGGEVLAASYTDRFEVTASGIVPFRQTDPRDRAWFAQGCASAEALLVGPYVGADGDVAVTATQGVCDEDGTVQAVIAVDLSTSALTAALDAIPYGETSRAVITDVDGNVAAWTSNLDAQVTAAVDQEGDVPTLAQVGMDREADEDAVVWDIAIGDGDWLVHAEMADTAAMRDVSTYQSTVFWALGATAIVTVALVVVALVVRHPMARLEKAASTDPLTGLANRASLLLQGREVARAFERNGGTLVACVMDLDGFKALNDRWGHAAGDDTLVAVADAMREWIRVDEVASRTGGDEFVVLLHRRDRDDPVAVAGELRSLAAAAATAAMPRVPAVASTRAEASDADEWRVGVTIGVAVQVTGRVDLTELIGTADAALVDGKSRAKGEVYLAGSPTGE